MDFLTQQQELGRRILEQVGSEGVWTTTERKLALNLSQLDMVRELKLLKKYATATTVVGQQNYSISAAGGFNVSNFFGMLELRYDDGTSKEDQVVAPVTIDQLYERFPSWRFDANADPPTHYFDPDGGTLINDLIGLYPKPATGVASSLRLHCLLRPADMVGDTDKPFNTTAGTTLQYPSLEPFHDALVYRAAHRLYQDDTPQLADRFWALYQSILSRAIGDTFMPTGKDAASVKVTTGYRAGRTW